MLQVLPKERWPELKETFKREFGTELPHPTATIVAEVDEDGTIGGFMVCEILFQIDQIYHPGKNARVMFDYFHDQIPRQSSVIVMVDRPRSERLCQSYGMRKESGVVYRKDF